MINPNFIIDVGVCKHVFHNFIVQRLIKRTEKCYYYDGDDNGNSFNKYGPYIPWKFLGKIEILLSTGCGLGVDMAWKMNFFMKQFFEVICGWREQKP